MNEQSLDLTVELVPDTTAEPESVRTSQSYANDKTLILNRLRRIEGQVRGVQRMVEDEQSCLDVLTQLSAIIAGMKVPGLLIEDNIRGSVVGADPSNHEADLTELNAAIASFTRSVG